MCVFIAVSIAGYRGDAALSFRERRLFAEPISAEFGAPLPADGSTLSISDGHCACSVYAGGAAQPGIDMDAERRRYQRKGWSQSKTERAIDAKRAAHERPAREHELAKAFAAAIEDLMTSGARVKLLASDYDSSFHVSGYARLALGDLVSSGGMFPQNTLVTIEV